jgi:Secretion system C-terminal sorting domain
MKKSTFLKGITSLAFLFFVSKPLMSQTTIWAATACGDSVSSYSVTLGTYNSGPSQIFDPFPGSNNTTAALGKNAQGCYFYIPNTSDNNGSVSLWRASNTGTGQAQVATLDLNGASNVDFGFVRLGVSPNGIGWILAGVHPSSNPTASPQLYLACFNADCSGTITITLVDDNVTFLNNEGNAANFQNGDLCVDGVGKILVLANNSSTTPTSTEIYSIDNLTSCGPNSNVVLDRRFFVQTTGGGNFSGSVNGVAFDQFGNVYLSGANGSTGSLYYIAKSSIAGGNGSGPGTSTVQVQGPIWSGTCVTDLASNFFPGNSILPIKLISFSGSLKNNITTLTWETENAMNFSHFDIERSFNGIDFTDVGSKPFAGDYARRTSYSFADDLSAVPGNVIYYRLKMVDVDANFKYSNVILIRKGSKIIGLTINPNPVIRGGMATVRLESVNRGTTEFKVVDMSGKILLSQKNNISEGTNSISISNLERLQPGMYILQMNNGNEVLSVKFSITR